MLRHALVQQITAPPRLIEEELYTSKDVRERDAKAAENATHVRGRNTACESGPNRATPAQKLKRQLVLLRAEIEEANARTHTLRVRCCRDFFVSPTLHRVAYRAELSTITL